jgi:protease IV
MRTALRIILPLSIVLLFASLASAQGRSSDFPDYASGSQALVATPGTQGGAAAGFWNPAAWAAMKEWELSFLWNDHNIRSNRMDNRGLFIGGDGIGFAMRRNDVLHRDTTGAERRLRVDDYSIALGGGSEDNFWGMSYNWSRGNRDSIPRDHSLALGSIYRPFAFLSIGNAAQIGLNHGDYRFISDVGVRPFRNHCLTLFGDAAYGRYDNPTTMQWGAGVEIQPLNGLRVAGKISKPFADSQDKIYSLSLGFTLSDLGFHVIPHYNKDSERISTSYLIRLGGQAPSFDARPLFEKKTKVVSTPMKGRLTYQRARWFDMSRVSLLDMIELIEKSKNDPTVGGILLNLSGMETQLALGWEVREKLKDFQAAGKKVYVYTDRCDMSDYHLASVADYIIMDPVGNLYLPGYVMGRTYWKGVFDKLGLGVEEWRFFTYKSAFESFARRDMSEADREQRLALMEDFFRTWQSDVAAARRVTPEAVRAVIDSMVVVQPEEARAAGLVDTVAGWDDAKDIIKELTGDEPDFIRPREVEDKTFADQTWGLVPKIALVYAVGECDMDSGIRGRATSRALRSLAKRKDVKAVVLRADSPGGDALPSDLVARQMKEVSKKKPMIVSQGQVAASGGYWISMNGDRIFTSPMTVTGSIGVIGGWIWNDGFSEKSGFTSDYVKIGEHADLMSGITLPLIGLTIPHRNLTDVEKLRMEKLMRGMYSDFTAKVADARLLTASYVDSIGQGRVWTGPKAVEIGLADEIGGLEKAIDYARTSAKLKKDKFSVLEYPRRSWFNFEDFGQPPTAVGTIAKFFLGDRVAEEKPTSDYELAVLRRISSNPGMPLPMLSPEDLPLEGEPIGK